MHIYSDGALAAIESGQAIFHGALKIYTSAGTDDVRVWGGFGKVTIDGELYVGLGNHGLMSTSGSSLGGADQNITATLSGVDPEALKLYDMDNLRASLAIAWLLTFNATGSDILDARVLKRGRLDQSPVQIGEDGTIAIVASIMGAARGLGRMLSRVYSDADQRKVSEDDGGCRFIAAAPSKSLYWGGQIPTSASAAS